MKNNKSETFQQESKFTIDWLQHLAESQTIAGCVITLRRRTSTQLIANVNRSFRLCICSRDGQLQFEYSIILWVLQYTSCLKDDKCFYNKLRKSKPLKIKVFAANTFDRYTFDHKYLHIDD